MQDNILIKNKLSEKKKKKKKRTQRTHIDRGTTHYLRMNEVADERSERIDFVCESKESSPSGIGTNRMDAATSWHTVWTIRCVRLKVHHAAAARERKYTQWLSTPGPERRKNGISRLCTFEQAKRVCTIEHDHHVMSVELRASTRPGKAVRYACRTEHANASHAAHTATLHNVFI